VYFLKELLLQRLIQLEFEKSYPDWTWGSEDCVYMAARKLVNDAKRPVDGNMVTVALPVCCKNAYKTGELKIGVWSDMIIHMMLNEKTVKEERILIENEAGKTVGNRTNSGRKNSVGTVST
jgi:hypothetical protein